MDCTLTENVLHLDVKNCDREEGRVGTQRQSMREANKTNRSKNVLGLVNKSYHLCEA